MKKQKEKTRTVIIKKIKNWRIFNLRKKKRQQAVLSIEELIELL